MSIHCHSGDKECGRLSFALAETQELWHAVGSSCPSSSQAPRLQSSDSQRKLLPSGEEVLVRAFFVTAVRFFVRTLFLALLVHHDATANVHVIQADGEGDFETVQLAISAASPGD